MCNNLVKSVFAHSSSHLPQQFLTNSKQALQEFTLFPSSVREMQKWDLKSICTCYLLFNKTLSACLWNQCWAVLSLIFVITSTPRSLKIFKLWKNPPGHWGLLFILYYFLFFYSFQISDVAPLASIQKRDLALNSDKFLEPV
jgi:hypothetical protein